MCLTCRTWQASLLPALPSLPLSIARPMGRGLFPHKPLEVPDVVDWAEGLAEPSVLFASRGHEVGEGLTIHRAESRPLHLRTSLAPPELPRAPRRGRRRLDRRRRRRL